MKLIRTFVIKTRGYLPNFLVGPAVGVGLNVSIDDMYLVKRLLKHRSGADMEEWPEDLKIREWPVHLKEVD